MLRHLGIAAIVMASFGGVEAFQTSLFASRQGLAGLNKAGLSPMSPVFPIPKARQSVRTGARAAVSQLVMRKGTMREFNPYKDDGKKAGWLSSQESQKMAFSVLALNWVFAGLLHFAVFSCLITTSVANHALYALAYGHFSLVVSALLSLGTAAKNNLLNAATYRRLNVGLALSGVAGLAVLLWPTVSTLATAGGWSFKILPKFSNSPLAVFTTCWTVGLLLASVLIPRRITDKSAVVGELQGLALSSAIMNTATQFFTPSSFGGLVYRTAAVFILAQFLLATFAPATMLGITGSAALASSELSMHAMKLWAASLVFQFMTACSAFSSADYSKRSSTYKKLNTGFALTFILQSFIWTTASIPYSTQSLTKPAVTKLTMKREPSVLTLLEDASLEPDVAKQVKAAEAAAPDRPAGAKKMTLWQEAMVGPTKFYNNELPKLVESSKTLTSNTQLRSSVGVGGQLLAYNALSLSIALYCAAARLLGRSQTTSGEQSDALPAPAKRDEMTGDKLFTLAVTSYQAGKLVEASEYLEACSKQWSADGVLKPNTAYSEALDDIANKIGAAGEGNPTDSRENYLKLANNCVEQAMAALDADDISGANKWWNEAEMWYSAAEE